MGLLLSVGQEITLLCASAGRPQISFCHTPLLSIIFRAALHVRADTIWSGLNYSFHLVGTHIKTFLPKIIASVHACVCTYICNTQTVSIVYTRVCVYVCVLVYEEHAAVPGPIS